MSHTLLKITWWQPIGYLAWFAMGCWLLALTSTSNGNEIPSQLIIATKTSLPTYSNPATGHADAEKLPGRTPAIDPYDFLEYVSGSYGDTFSHQDLLRAKLTNRLDGAIETGTFEEWFEVSDVLEQAKVSLDRCRQHLSSASDEKSTTSVLLEASLAFTDLKAARLDLRVAKADLEFLIELIEFSVELGR